MTLICLIIFLFLMVLVGIWGMKKTETLGDFLLGGRSIGPWFSAFAYAATYFSAVLFIGFAGKIGWGFGLRGLWIAAGNALIGSLLAWWILGRRTRRMTKNLEAMTMPEFLQERYEGKYIKMFGAVITFVFLIPYSASVFKGLGYLFQVNFNISYDTALLVMIGITGLYLVLGGYFAVILTDFFQGIIKIFGASLMVWVIVSKSGGLSHTINAISLAYNQHIPVAKQPGTFLLACLVFMTSFGAWGMPQMVQKFYSIKDETMIKTAAIITFLFAAIVSFAAYFVGASAHLFYDKLPLLANGKPAFDRIIPDLLIHQLPESLMAIILLLILSASMSTLSSLILVSASAITVDLHKGYIDPHQPKEKSLGMMRLFSGLFIILSYVLARYQFAFIVTLMALSWGAVAGSFLAPYVYGLFWKRATRAGVWLGMITGLVTSVSLFFLWGQDKSPIASSIGMIVPFFIIPLVSMFTKPPSQATLDKAFNFKM
ncbi:MAG: sodium/solute symporter [Candidatus Omnitrophica bacterium]|nr:sodium/solute symporter [Candidatus Omnitrophota bacterium]